jgi:predicted Rossmann fold flavoprotein
MTVSKNNTWDLVVIGGGPAGMMAAGRAAERGLKVVLLEKNPGLGKKLLITGGGRSNITNAEFDTRKFLSKFKKSDQFLFSAFAEFGVKEALDFFHAHDMPTKVEAEKRAFPLSNKAESVLKTLVSYLKAGKVTVLVNSEVSGFLKDGGLVSGVKLKDGRTILGRSYILATGGKSRPETGSTGEGFKWLKGLGHTVTEPDAALVPIAIGNAWVKRLQGVSLPEVKATTYLSDVKQDAKKGKLLFTHFGISGPMVLNMSKDVGELLKYGSVTISLDLFPSLDHGALDQKIQEILSEQSNKQLKNSLGAILPAALVPVAIELSNIEANTPGHSLKRADRVRFVKTLKDMRMNVAGLLGVKKAVVTSGGVSLKEVDFKTMRSRLFSNLYLTGDVLNIDRPSGGYSLQLCWTTGYVAGSAAEN